MKKNGLKNTITILNLGILIYCISILVEKRINYESGFEFTLWSPYYLLTSILVPLALILPIKLLPNSSYSKLIIKKEKSVFKLINILTSVIILWLLFWYGSLAIDKIFDTKLDSKVAEKVAIEVLKNDSIFMNRSGKIERFDPLKSIINNHTASFFYRIIGIDTTYNVNVLLSRDQEWVKDTVIYYK